MEKVLEQLEQYEKKLFGLRHMSSVLNYDGETCAPKKSDESRAEAMAMLSGLLYELTTGPDTVAMLEELRENQTEFDPLTRRKITVLLRDYDDVRKIPKDEYVEYSRLLSQASAVWHEAKVNDDFASFEPWLQKLRDTSVRIAGYRAPDADPYENMLDHYEKGLTVEKCDGFFACLRERLVPLIRAAAEKGKKVDLTPWTDNYPVELQRKFSGYLMQVMRIDPERCVLGEVEHPFTDGVSKYDVRITTHYHEDNPLSSMYSVIHEGGHALYELGVDDNITFSVLGGGVSMGIHESQSRFYENVIGRSKAFCDLIFPETKRIFAPRLDRVTPEEFYRAVNRVEPSLIRTEADEVTYCLHIMVRYELEKQFIGGKITAAELPEKWKELYREYLGVEVPNDREGVLQDSHWSGGLFGYFPSYAIGSAYGAQFLREMNRSFDVEQAVAKGDFASVNGWLEEKIWKYGCLFDPDVLFESVCGPFDPNVFADYLEEKIKTL